MIQFANEECGIRDFAALHAVDNPASGRVMEKCGFLFERYTEYKKVDGSETFPAKYYTMHIN